MRAPPPSTAQPVSEKPAADSKASQPAAEIAPLTSETFAKEANIEIKRRPTKPGSPADPSKEAPKDNAKDNTKDNAKDTAKETTKDNSKETSNPGRVAQDSPAMATPTQTPKKMTSAPPAPEPKEATTELKTDAPKGANSEPDHRAEAVPMSPPGASMAPRPAAEMPAGSSPTLDKVPPAGSEPSADALSQTALAETQTADGGSQIEVRRDSEGLRVTFAFAAATPAAMFRRADAVWLVFDTTTPIDIEPIKIKGGSLIADVGRFPLNKGQAIRFRLNRPQLPSLTGEDHAEGSIWKVAFADRLQAPTQPLAALRNIADPALANVTVPIANASRLHQLVDPDVGDTLMVITAPPPVRGFIRRQDFVEFSLLESIHGIAARPNSDDVSAEIMVDRIIFGRPGGLTLSPASFSSERAPAAIRPLFDIDEWHQNQDGNFLAHEDSLIAAAGMAAPEERNAARLALARFLMARGLYPEARGVAGLVLAGAEPGKEDKQALMMHAITSILTGRAEQGLKDLADPAIGGSSDAQLWKALGLAHQGKWAEAREKFKNVGFAINALPLELQRSLVVEAMRAALQVKDYSGADQRGSELEAIGVPRDMAPAVAVLRGQLAEALGRDKDALDDYTMAINSPDRGAATEAKLAEIELKRKRNEISEPAALRELETLAVTWRGDGIEAKTLQMMARIYSDTGHFADSFAAVREATRLQPNSDASRQAQDAAAALFSELFLTSKGDDLPPIEALAMFYEYRDLTPIGRRGDEMIRRLADRLVAVDLLDQASELLQYQVDKRLDGAARAQVATRLAMIYLTNRKPDRAIAALRSTRIADLSGELRQQRLLLEARAQSDVGRHDLALDIISNIPGREAIRLRSDIDWAARQWRESAEQLELYYGERWRNFKPLNPVEKGDVIRALVGFALAEDDIGVTRFREKYGPLMSGDADRAIFEIASKPANASSVEFAKIAKIAAKVDTLDGFLREMKARFPDMSARAPQPGSGKADPESTGALPEIFGMKQVEAVP
jgi:tetratricopeptide (TPR) repeat protein